MVMSAQGGMTTAMGAVLHGIANAVATVEGGDPAALRLDLFERLAIAVTRANSRAIMRRRTHHSRTAVSAHRYLASASALLEEPPEG